MKLSASVWVWIPVLGLSVGVIASLALVITAHRIRPTKVEAMPYQASAHYDADKERRAAFINTHGELQVTPLAKSVRLQLVMPPGASVSGPAQVSLWRPDDEALDSTVLWENTTQPMVVPLARPGRWRLHLELPPSPQWRTGACTDTMVEVPSTLPAPTP